MSAEQTPGQQPSPPANQDATQPGTPDTVQNAAPGTAGPVDPIADLEARLAAAQAKADENYDLLLRAKAETENVRRRGQDDVNKAHKFAVESFAESLVPVKDSLEAALAQKDQTLQSLREGVEITLRQLTGAFERNKLVEVAPAAGDKFDPHQHQAISSVPSDQPANTVVMTLQKGYLIAERVLRPALVTVSAGV
jgi:molecular chaperone GrpE